jgi:hypothetical protein
MNANEYLTMYYRNREYLMRRSGQFDMAVAYQALADYTEKHPECSNDGDAPRCVFDTNWGLT